MDTAAADASCFCQLSRSRSCRASIRTHATRAAGGIEGLQQPWGRSLQQRTLRARDDVGTCVVRRADTQGARRLQTLQTALPAHNARRRKAGRRFRRRRVRCALRRRGTPSRQWVRTASRRRSAECFQTAQDAQRVSTARDLQRTALLQRTAAQRHKTTRSSHTVQEEQRFQTARSSCLQTAQSAQRLTPARSLQPAQIARRSQTARRLQTTGCLQAA